jgi:mRNA-degrading endonuclease RelE of RelBE toxin-antitoxin system
MSYKIVAISRFERELKRLAKKYRSLGNDLQVLHEDLQKDPEHGKPLGGGVYKIRLAIGSKGKGKSGGARVITYVKVEATTIYLLSIYDKSEVEDISDSELKACLREIPS